jgi:hypothetical protein
MIAGSIEIGGHFAIQSHRVDTEPGADLQRKAAAVSQIRTKLLLEVIQEAIMNWRYVLPCRISPLDSSVSTNLAFASG